MPYNIIVNFFENYFFFILSLIQSLNEPNIGNIKKYEINITGLNMAPNKIQLL